MKECMSHENDPDRDHKAEADEFARQMEAVRNVMDKDWAVLRALALR